VEYVHLCPNVQILVREEEAEPFASVLVLPVEAVVEAHQVRHLRMPVQDSEILPVLVLGMLWDG
jgi:hypothetical protein